MGDVLAAAGGSQSVVDKILKWQDIGHRWGHFSRNTVAGHRDVSRSSYAEINHSSIKAIVGDDPGRSVEKTVTALLKRDKGLVRDRQRDKYRWGNGRASHLSGLPAKRAADLSQYREKLDEKPYDILVEEYDRHLQYNITDEERDGVYGCLIRHANIPESEGRFIPDGRKCMNSETPCETSLAMTFCRHDIAKCKHRKVPIYDAFDESIAYFHLFYTFVPRLRVNGSWVESVARRPDDNITVLEVGHSFSPSNSFDGDDDMKEDGNVIQGVGVLDEPVTAPAASRTNFAGVLTSPSKQYMPTSSNAAGSCKELRKQVPYNDFLKHGENIGAMAKSLDLDTQHALNTHLLDIRQMIRCGDYTSPRYTGTSVEGLAKVLAVVAKDRASSGGGMPVSQVAAKPGRLPVHRLGAENSTVNKKPSTCSFCRRQGCRKDVCAVKRGFGEDLKVNTKSATDIAKRLETIAKGDHTGFKDIASVLSADAISSKEELDGLPTNTKYLQVKGYHRKEEKTFLFCTCINKEGEILSRNYGDGTKSYADVLIDINTVKVSLLSLTYVFLKQTLLA